MSLSTAERRVLAIAASLFLAVLASGCSEVRKYWDRSPTAPEAARDVTPPSVRVLTPSGPDDARATPVTGEATVVIAAEDDVGIAMVQLHVDDAPAVVVSGPPWEHRWNTGGLGEGTCHRLWAVAADLAGNVAASDTVFARAFNSGPGVAITAPTDGALVKGAVTVTAEIAGGSPAIERVEFLSDATVAGTATAAPWTVSLDTGALAPGDHFLTARATTALGLTGVSAALRIRVNNETPAVAIDFPLDGHRVAARGTLVLSCAALDAVEGAVAPDRVAWRSSRDGAIGAGRYLRVRNLSVGSHTLTATAVNAWGTEGSASLAIEVIAQPTYTFCANIQFGLLGPRCFSCHHPGAADWPTHHLDFSSYAGLMAGGVTRDYEAIVPCRPESSLVWNKITADVPWVGAPMPPAPNPKVPATVREKLRVWILEGAPPDEPEACN